jgi:hypothetical protein
MRSTLTTLLLSLLMGATILLAPDTARASGDDAAHVVTESQLDAALAATGDARDVQERRLQALLARPEVQALADGAGLDLARAQRAVATLTDAELADLDARAAQYDAALAGGDNIVVTPYGLTIILLIIIVIILVA